VAGFERIAALGDIPLDFRSVDEAGAAALALFVGSAPRSPGPALGTVRAGGVGPRLAARDPDQVYDDRCVWVDGEELTVLDATGVVGRAGCAGAVIGGGPRDATAALGVRRLFLTAVGHVLGFHDRFLVHAGGVVVDGRTLLVLGSSGEGKSTVALAALAQGWPVLSDDLTVLRCDDGVIRAAGVPRPPTVPTDLGVPSVARARRVADDPRDRAELPAEVLTQGFHAVDAVLVVGHGTRPRSALQPVSGREVHLLLVGSFPPASHPGQLRRAHPAFAAVSRLPARRLAHGTDGSRRLASTAAEIRRFSEGLAGSP
jgi:hypothetical protein